MRGGAYSGYYSVLLSAVDSDHSVHVIFYGRDPTPELQNMNQQQCQTPR
jgi:hypothetical protein